MKLKWQISRKDVSRVRALVRQQANNPLVRKRMANNLAKTKSQVRRKRFWFSMVSMRLTSVQRSGPNSHVSNFIRTQPFPLGYEATCGAPRVETFIAKELKTAGGIRFRKIIAQQLAANFDILEKGEWRHAIKQCNRLTQPVSAAVEKEAANYVEEKFVGFGHGGGMGGTGSFSQTRTSELMRMAE